MSTNVTVKSRIRINGREYAGVEDMPAELRDAYERAMSTIGDGERKGLNASDIPGNAQAGPTTAIVFNGQDYASVDEMPADVRRLYDRVIAALTVAGTSAHEALEAGPGQGQGSEGSRAVRGSPIGTDAIRPESTSPRLIIAGIVISALLLATFVFGR